MECHVETDARSDEVIRIARDLIRLDSSNFGSGKSRGERTAAELARSELEEVGLTCTMYEPEPGRSTLVTRWPGSDPSLSALLVHGHLDVVPAPDDGWSADPFGGEISGGMLWGRGAVDMKGMIAMTLSAVRNLIRAGHQPRRDIVLALFADEEAGGALGSSWMVRHHPYVFRGVREAISEVGGFSVDVAGKRVYLLQTGEKGLIWVRLTAMGVAGHASQDHPDSAIARLSSATARLAATEWAVELTETTGRLVTDLRGLAGLSEETDAVAVASSAGLGSRMIIPGLKNTANVTMIEAGFKENVVPGKATAILDIRYLPGHRERVIDRIRQIVGTTIDAEILLDLPALESPVDSPLVGKIVSTLSGLDSGSFVIPFLSAASTDNKSLADLGIRGYGFSPLRLPADLDFGSLFHGVDERIPLDALRFGRDVLAEFLRTY